MMTEKEIEEVVLEEARERDRESAEARFDAIKDDVELEEWEAFILLLQTQSITDCIKLRLSIKMDLLLYRGMIL